MKILLVVVLFMAASHGQQLTQTHPQTAPSMGRAFDASVVTLRAAIAADAISTEMALSRPGVYEANPMQRNRYVRIGSHAALAVALPMIEKRVFRNHPKLAAVLNFGLAAGFAVISGSNVQLARFK